MGVIFGAPTVASMTTIKAAVFTVGGIPTGEGIQDPPPHEAAQVLGRRPRQLAG